MHNARSELKSALRSLFTLNPQKGPRRWIATRAALSMGVPLAVMTFAGRPDLGLQAGTGAFLALFFAGAQAKERAKVLPVMAAALLTCAAIGTWLAPWPWVSATVMVFVAIAGSAFAFGFRIGPPGPVFFVLMYGLASMITAEYDGARRIDPLVFLTALASGLAFAYLLALLPLLLRSQRTRPARTLRELLPGPWLGDGEGWLIARVAVVSAAGMVVSMLWIDPGRAYWTVAAGIAVIGLSTVPTHALSRGMHRTFGTLVGALLYLVIAPLGAHPWVFVLLLAGLQFVIELVVVRNYGVALVFITPLVLIIAGAAMGSTDHLTTATERLVDTAVGSALAMASGFLQRPGAAARASR